MKKEFIVDLIKKNPLFFLFACALTFYVFWTWLPLGVFHSWNEAYYMMRVTHISNGGSYLDWGFDNPPLFVYILTALSKISLNLIFFRLFMVLCTILSAFLVYKIGLVFADKKTALLSSAMFAFFPLVMLFSKKLQIEMFALLLMTLSFYFAVLGVEKKDLFFHFSALFLGLTILTKFPFALVGIAIFYYMYKKKVGIFRIFFTFFEAGFVSSIWFIYVFFSSPSFFGERVASSSNLFGLGNMHASAPIYQIILLSIAVLTLFFLVFLFVFRRPVNIEEKTLFLFALIFAVFFFLLPNHEYYLIPFFVPIFVYFALKFSKKRCIRLVGVFFIISLVFLVARPFYEVDWEVTNDYIEENFSDKNVTIYSTNPRVSEYYLKDNVTWLKPSMINTFLNNTVVSFTCYDIANLKSVNLWNKIKEDLVLFKQWDDKTFVYGGENLK